MSRNKLYLAPSMGCCDLFDFKHQVEFIDSKADFLHIDIKDGNYVKTYSIGPDFMKTLKPVVKTPMDAHLMVKHPQWIDAVGYVGNDLYNRTIVWSTNRRAYWR